MFQTKGLAVLFGREKSLSSSLEGFARDSEGVTGLEVL